MNCLEITIKSDKVNMEYLTNTGIYMEATKQLDNDVLRTLEYESAMKLIESLRKSCKTPKKVVEVKPRIQLMCEHCGYKTESAHILRKHRDMLHCAIPPRISQIIV